jgi:hypothetical protein
MPRPPKPQPSANSSAKPASGPARRQTGWTPPNPPAAPDPFFSPPPADGEDDAFFPLDPAPLPPATPEGDLSLLDQFAGQALTGILAGTLAIPNTVLDATQAAQLAYRCAVAMLRERPTHVAPPEMVPRPESLTRRLSPDDKDFIF